MKIPTNLYPLKKVVGAEGDRSQWDVLECGHKLYRASDMYGERSPDKRRCRHCWAALPQVEKERLAKAYEDRRQERSRQRQKAFLYWARQRD